MVMYSLPHLEMVQVLGKYLSASGPIKSGFKVTEEEPHCLFASSSAVHFI